MNQVQNSPSTNNVPFYKQQHYDYLMALDKSKDLDSIGYYLSEHLRLPGAYWTINSLACLNQLTTITQEKKTQLVQWLKSCQNDDGGFGGNTHHDSHITNTHYAILLCFLLDCFNQINLENAINYIAARQKEDGSFEGDIWGETDSRFSYCALSSLTLLNKRDKINLKTAGDYIKRCKNYDGSFGGQQSFFLSIQQLIIRPNAESHGAYVFCCVGTLMLCEQLDSFNHDDLAMWLKERQTLKGGFNGRPEKLADVCYSWWIYSALYTLKVENWIDQPALETYILQVYLQFIYLKKCQDDEGGISDRPQNQVDVFHTFFGLAALSLIDENMCQYELVPIDPVFALPRKILQEKCGWVEKYIVKP